MNTLITGNGLMIALRNVAFEDEDFLFKVYSSTRQDEMALVNWTQPAKEAFLRMQFNFQRQYYAENYPDAQYQIILLDGQPIGRLYLHRRENEIRIIDIALLPEYRKRGIGSSVLKKILEQGQALRLRVTIHVERFNPALHLYERLGFCLLEDKGVYLLLEWTPTVMEADVHAG